MDPLPDNINDIQTIRQLIEAGTDPNKQYMDGTQVFTLLHNASSNGHFDIVQYLVQNGANVNAIDQTGDTPLHHAALFSNIQIVRYLVESGAYVNSMDRHGFTPLHCAACDLSADDEHPIENIELYHELYQANGFETVRYLLENGADNCQLTWLDQTAAQCARESRHYDIADYIEGYEYQEPTKGVHE